MIVAAKLVLPRSGWARRPPSSPGISRLSSLDDDVHSPVGDPGAQTRLRTLSGRSASGRLSRARPASAPPSKDWCHWCCSSPHGGGSTAVAAFAMVCFSPGILSAIPMGATGMERLRDLLRTVPVRRPLPPAALSAMTNPFSTGSACRGVCVVIAGNLFPRKIPSCPACATTRELGHHALVRHAVGGSQARQGYRRDRHHAGLPNWRSSTRRQREAAQIPIYVGYAFRRFQHPRQGPFSLAHRAMADRDEDDHSVTDGERICSMAIGWNFGDGRMQRTVIAALQRRCHFEPGKSGWCCSTRNRCTVRPKTTGSSTPPPGSSEQGCSRRRRDGGPPTVGRRCSRFAIEPPTR